MASAQLLPPSVAGIAAAQQCVLREYFHAKDENRPHLLEHVFAEPARLAVVNRSQSIAFPETVSGRDAIADVFVRRFNQSYENIYSFYLSRPDGTSEVFTCGWLVVMTDKADARVRLGSGRYAWRFDAAAPHLAVALTITIETMVLLPATAWPGTLAWMRRLDYPWTNAAAALHVVPVQPELQALRTNLQALAVVTT
jgi:hypothetical protein